MNGLNIHVSLPLVFWQELHVQLYGTYIDKISSTWWTLSSHKQVNLIREDEQILYIKGSSE